MGYHVIIDPEFFPIKYTYVERIEELLSVEGISDKSIIFQGYRENPPQQVGMSGNFERLGEEGYRAELRALAIFAKLARARKLILEELSREPENAKLYSKIAKGPVKRGNFLIHNRGNIEIAVKCVSYYGKGERKFFAFSEEELQKYLNVEKATKTPVLLAVFQRRNDTPVEESFCMVEVDLIQKLIDTFGRRKKEYGWIYSIPLKITKPGFDLLVDYGLEDQEDVVDLVERGYTPYLEREEGPYVLVAYYKNQSHFEWIVDNGLYNLRMGTARGALTLGSQEAGAEYILLHTKGEFRTGKIFRILDNSPRIYSRDVLIRKKYPGLPGHAYYFIYRVIPVEERELRERVWDISKFPGYITGHLSAFPFAVPLSELLK